MRQTTIFTTTLIAIALSLSSSTLTISFQKDIGIQPDKIRAKWRADSSVSSDVNMWQILELPSLSTAVSNSRNRISFSKIESHFAYQDERMLDADIFQQEGTHQPTHLRKKLTKRSPGLEGLLNGGREIEEAIGGSKAAETISDITKVHDLKIGPNDGLINTKSVLNKADSFRGPTSKLNAIPTLTRSKSLPSVLSGVSDQKATLEAMNTRFDRSILQITEDIFKTEIKPKPVPAQTEGGEHLFQGEEEEEIEYDEFEKQYQKDQQRPLAFEAFLSLYAEKELFQTIIDGKEDIKTINALANLVDIRREAYANSLKTAIKAGVEDRTFLNYGTTQSMHAEVVALRKLISEPKIDLTKLKNANDLSKGRRISFPENLAKDELRGKNSDLLFKKPLMDITADEYLSALTGRKSSIYIAPAEDVDEEVVKASANEALHADHLYDTDPTSSTYKAARTARKQYQHNLYSYIAKNEKVNYKLFTDLQEIINRKGIPLEIKTPPRSRVLIWYDRFKVQYQSFMSRLRSFFKRDSKSRIAPIYPA